MIGKQILEALKKRYQAQVAEADLQQLIFIFNNPVGIGEHPQHLDEIDKLLGKIKECRRKNSLIDKGEWTK